MYSINFLALLAVTGAAAQSLNQVLSANSGTLSTLNSILATIPQITQTLAASPNITILAPSNDAFTKFLASNPTAQAETKNATLVTALLSYHVVNGMFMSSAFQETPMFPSSKLVAPFSNVTGGQRVELVKEGNMAMIMSGFKQMSMVTQADIMFNNGVIHVIDSVLNIPRSPAETATDTGLTSVAGALMTANLALSVNELMDATIFAPSNAAFEAVGSVVQAADRQTLSTVLSYHVLKMKEAMFSTMLEEMVVAGGGQAEIETLQGGKVTVRVENGNVFVNSAKVVIPDVLTSNGVVHVLDNVLNPMAASGTPNPTAATQSPAFTGASAVRDAPFTSAVTPTTTLLPATAASSNSKNAGAFGAVPTAALMGVVGGAAVFANL